MGERRSRLNSNSSRATDSHWAIITGHQPRIYKNSRLIGIWGPCSDKVSRVGQKYQLQILLGGYAYVILLIQNETKSYRVRQNSAWQKVGEALRKCSMCQLTTPSHFQTWWKLLPLGLASRGAARSIDDINAKKVCARKIIGWIFGPLFLRVCSEQLLLFLVATATYCVVSLA